MKRWAVLNFEYLKSNIGPSEILFEKIHRKLLWSNHILRKLLSKTQVSSEVILGVGYICSLSESQFLMCYFTSSWSFSKNWQAFGKVNNSVSKICLCLQTTEMKQCAPLLLWIFLTVLKMQTQIWNRKRAKDFKSSLHVFLIIQCFQFSLRWNNLEPSFRPLYPMLQNLKRFLEKCGFYEK